MLRCTPAWSIGPFAVYMREQSWQKRRTFSGEEAKKFAAKYNRLTATARMKYAAMAYRETAAVKKNEHHRRQPAHQSTIYSLVMRLLHDPELFGSHDFFDSRVSGKIAASTVSRLSDEDKAALVKKFESEGTTRLAKWSKKDYAPEQKSDFVAKAHASAYAFDSFTAMAHGCLGNDTRTIFFSVSRLGSGQRPTSFNTQLNQKRWRQIVGKVDEKAYQPLSPAEAPLFERFCADRAGSFKETKFPIGEWFCEFRKLKWSFHSTKPSVMATREELRRYRECIAIDSQHTFYERVLSSKEKSASTAFVPSAVPVSGIFSGVVCPSTYASVIPEHDVLQVARNIASTRVGKSVYESCVDHLNNRLK